MSKDRDAKICKKINLTGIGLILAWNTWNKDTAEHEKARWEIMGDFTNNITKLIEAEFAKRCEGIETEIMESSLCDKARVEGLATIKDVKILATAIKTHLRGEK